MEDVRGHTEHVRASRVKGLAEWCSTALALECFKVRVWLSIVAS